MLPVYGRSPVESTVNSRLSRQPKATQTSCYFAQTVWRYELAPSRGVGRLEIVTTKTHHEPVHNHVAACTRQRTKSASTPNRRRPCPISFGLLLLLVLVREVETRKNRTPFPTVTVVDPSYNIGSDDSSESNTRGHAVIPKGDVSIVIEHLSSIQEGCNLEIRGGTGNLCAYQMNTFLDTQRDEMLINEAIDTISPQIVLPSQRALLEERHLIPDRRLEVRPHDENRALRLTWEQLLDFDLIAGIEGVIAVADILIHFSIGRHGHPIGR